jgi:hypothetical protein
MKGAADDDERDGDVPPPRLTRRVDGGTLFVSGGARNAEADGMAERNAVATTRAAAAARLRGVMVRQAVKRLSPLSLSLFSLSSSLFSLCPSLWYVSYYLPYYSLSFLFSHFVVTS